MLRDLTREGAGLLRVSRTERVSLSWEPTEMTRMVALVSVSWPAGRQPLFLLWAPPILQEDRMLRWRG